MPRGRTTVLFNSSARKATNILRYAKKRAKSVAKKFATQPVKSISRGATTFLSGVKKRGMQRNVGSRRSAYKK